MTDNQLKFLAAVLLMSLWGALVIWHGANQDLYVSAIYGILLGLGIIHATNGGPKS